MRRINIINIKSIMKKTRGRDVFTEFPFCGHQGPHLPIREKTLFSVPKCDQFYSSILPYTLFQLHFNFTLSVLKVRHSESYMQNLIQAAFSRNNTAQPCLLIM